MPQIPLDKGERGDRILLRAGGQGGGCRGGLRSGIGAETELSVQVVLDNEKECAIL